MSRRVVADYALLEILLLFARETQVGPMTAQLGEIGCHDAKTRFELHEHRRHLVREQGRVPEPPSLVGVLVAPGIDGEVLTRDFADPGQTGEVLMIVGGQRFAPRIGRAKIVKGAAVENGNDERAGAR
jgi:hypothetical protein